MSSLKKFDYRIKDNRKRNIFLCGIVLAVVTIVGVKLFNSYATFSNETNELTMVNAKTKVYPTAVEKITELSKTSTNSELRYDGTTDNNLRYIGKNPHNYVKFNDEDWRIIGVMNNIEDGSGNKDTRVKLIKAEGIGQISWDNNCLSNELDENKSVGNNCVGGYTDGNNWEESTLQILLNEIYINSIKSEKYYRWTDALSGFGYGPNAINSKRKYEKIDFTKTGIKREYHNMIDTIKYKLGRPDWSGVNNSTPYLFYNIERSDSTYSNKITEWTGQIGLMYPSDYGFATAGGIGIDTWSDKEYSTSLDECMSIVMNDWNNETNVGCRDNDWLYHGNKIVVEWTMISMSDNGYKILDIYDNGVVDIMNSEFSYLVRPVLYLKPNVRIMGGTGTKDDPFTLTI